MMGMTARAGALLLQQQPFYGLAPSRVVIGQPVLQPTGAPSALRSLPVNVPMARAVSAPARPTKPMKMPLDDVKLVMAVTNASGQLERLGHRPSGPICAAESGAAALRHLGYRVDASGQLLIPDVLPSAREAALRKENETLRRQMTTVLELNETAAVATAEAQAAAKAAQAEQAVNAQQLQHSNKVSEKRRTDKEKYRRRALKLKKKEKHYKEMLKMSDFWDEQFRRVATGVVPPEQASLKHLWECQLRALKNPSHRCRWHPKIMEWCAAHRHPALLSAPSRCPVALGSPALLLTTPHHTLLRRCARVWRMDHRAYEQMAHGDVVILPHPDTVRKHCSNAAGEQDNSSRLQLIADEVKDFSARGKQVAVKFDEVNTQCGLAFKIKGDSYEFFGFADAISELQMFEPDAPAADQSIEEKAAKATATHCLFFQVESLGHSSYRRVAAIHPVNGLNSSGIDTLFWQLVERLNRVCQLTVKAVVCDGAGANRSFIKLNTHGYAKGSNEFRPGHACCRNQVAPSAGFIWFVPDMSHFLKKSVNNFEKSFPQSGGTREMIIPDAIVQLIVSQVTDIAPPPPSEDDDEPMEPPQQLPEEEQSGRPDIGNLAYKTAGEECYVMLMGRLYELLTDRVPYYQGSLQKEPRIMELLFILKVVRTWHQYNLALYSIGPKTLAERRAWGLSHQLLFDLECMVEGFVGLVDDLLLEHGSLALLASPTLNQDTLESLFGVLRYSSGGGRDVTCSQLQHGTSDAQKRQADRKELKQRLKKRNADPDAAQEPAWKRRAYGEVTQQAAAPRWRLAEPPNFNTWAHALVWSASQPYHNASAAHPVSWKTMREIQRWDEQHNLKLMHHLTPGHFDRSGYDRMNVGLAKDIMCVPTARALHFLRLWGARIGK